MGLVRTTLIVAGFCLALSACNTTDALTPPEAIGDVSSSPVTQRDVERMATAPQRRQTYPGTQDSYGYQQQTSQQAYQSQSYGGGGSLDDQASALKSNGTNPYASRPLDDAAPLPSPRPIHRHRNPTSSARLTAGSRTIRNHNSSKPPLISSSNPTNSRHRCRRPQRQLVATASAFCRSSAPPSKPLHRYRVNLAPMPARLA
ncbi:hypothetical protein [Rhizobium sp. P44RR-XXIV]|uniref:hypothetical protein n=1 Tax=Rhizobium sp. P44RR-XXIV TaxID=1921145 RepID=UPI00269EBE85